MDEKCSPKQGVQPPADDRKKIDNREWKEEEEKMKVEEVDEVKEENEEREEEEENEGEEEEDAAAAAVDRGSLAVMTGHGVPRADDRTALVVNEEDAAAKKRRNGGCGEEKSLDKKQKEPADCGVEKTVRDGQVPPCGVRERRVSAGDSSDCEDMQDSDLPWMDEREEEIPDEVSNDEWRNLTEWEVFYNRLRQTPRPLDDPAARFFIDGAADPSDSGLDMDDPKMRREYVNCLEKPVELPMEEDDYEGFSKQFAAFFQSGLEKLRRYDCEKHLELVGFNCLKERGVNGVFDRATSAPSDLGLAVFGVLRHVSMHTLKLPREEGEWDSYMAEVLFFIKSVNDTLRTLGANTMDLILESTYFLRPVSRPAAATAIRAAAPADCDPAHSAIVATAASAGLHEIVVQLGSILTAVRAVKAAFKPAIPGLASKCHQLKERVKCLEATNEHYKQQLTTQHHQINQMRKESEKAAQAQFYNEELEEAEENYRKLLRAQSQKEDEEERASMPAAAAAARGDGVDVKDEVKKEEEDDDESGGCNTTAAVAGPTSCRKRRGTEESEDCVIVWQKAGKVQKLQKMTSSRAASGATSSSMIPKREVKEEESKE